MTHLWRSEEVYTIDLPDCRIMDVHGKNQRWPIRIYLRKTNSKITDVRFDPHYGNCLVHVEHPKYPKSVPYFTQDDVSQLLRRYMDYVNMSSEECHEYFAAHIYDYDTVKELADAKTK